MRILLKKKNKYNAKKITYDGETFDSAKEAKRWSELRLMEAAGLITDLRRQVPFCLVPAQQGGIRSEREVTYVADFVYKKHETEKKLYCKTHTGEKVAMKSRYKDPAHAELTDYMLDNGGWLELEETPSEVEIIEDVKGFITPEYKIKRKLMKLYGHEITEV